MMLQFISGNIGTIVVGAVVLAIVTAVVVQIIRDKKKGECTSCGCCPGSCPSANCHMK